MKKNSYKKIFFICILLNIFNLIRCYSLGYDDNQKEDIKVSIIIPTYNSADYLERSVGHALNQTLQEIEVIVVDDKSTDNTLEVLKKFENDRRLKVISLDHNQGPGVARNAGMKLAKGEFIGFIDSDDYVDDRFYEHLYQYSKNKDVVIGIFVNSTNYSDKYIHHRKLYSYGCVGDSIWRKKFLNKHHIEFAKGKHIGEDVLFRKKVMKNKPKKFQAPDEGIYYYYKRREGSLMNYKLNYIENLTDQVNKNTAN